MTRAILSLIMSFTVVALVAADGYRVKYDQPASGTHQLEFTLGDFGVATTSLQGASYSRISFEGRIVTNKKGFAEVPYLNASVMLDPSKNVSLEIIPGAWEEIPLTYPLVPSRGVIYRTQDPESVPYGIDPKSITDSWYPVNLAENTTPFILRDIRGTSVYVYPFQYNAARQVLRVYHQITVRLVENSTTPVNPLLSEARTIVREMDAVYRSVFINYGQVERDDLTIGEFGDILVVTTSRDESAIQPYVQWKREKGYDVTVEVVATGTVVNNTVQTAYDANNEILYVQLVGDWADIKCTTSGGGRPMDPQVGCVVGTDDFADIAVGRFSANSPADVTTQVDKVINYEKLPETGGTWYQAAVGIASAEGAGIGDDGESDAQHETVIYNDKLDPFTYNGFTQIYDPGASASMVTNAVNTGTSVINYTGHGWGDGWGTTGFNSSNVAGLSNGNKLPFIVSVACNNGDFDLGTCFAESWLRKSGGGAIVFLGASISQPWAEPMRGQDYFMDVLIGGYDYTAHPGQNGISTTEQRTTLGSIVFNGLTLMCVESGGSSDWETAKTWNYFGDPSVQARTASPAELLLSNTLVMVGVPFTTNVTSGGEPVANGMVALSQGDLFYHGVTDEAGNVTLPHELLPGTAKLVVTAFNTETMYEDVNVIPPGGPYVTVASVEISDTAGNGNGLMDYGETVYLTIGLANVGTEDATNVTTTISSADQYVTIPDPAADYGTIPAGDTVFVTEGFQVSALESIPDFHMVLFGLEATGGTRETWTGNFSIHGHAPVLVLMEYSIDDSYGNGNGRLDPGEAVTLHITTLNAGSADAYNVTGNLSTEDLNVSILTGSGSYGTLTAGNNNVQSFEIEIDENTPMGDAPVFVFDMAADLNITGYDEFVEYIGQIPVLIVDWDLNHNSPDAIEQCLTSLEVGYERVEEFPENLSLYASIFVCLGTYPDNTVLNADQGQVLADYLEAGGNLYMEGADTWYYDQQFTPTPVHPMFNIGGESDGAGDLSNEEGQAGSIAEGMNFAFSGENSYIDHISAHVPAIMMFMNAVPPYGTGVSQDAGTYKTIGFSFEFGGLQDGEKSKGDLMIEMLDFFGIQGIWTSTEENPEVSSIPVNIYPNPFRDETVIRFENPERGRVSVEIYNLSGQVISRLMDAEVPEGIHEIRWDGSTTAGTRTAEGLYFFRLHTGNGVTTGRLMRIE
jgi:hypothetical protein